jgi:hypothetical protein
MKFSNTLTAAMVMLTGLVSSVTVAAETDRSKMDHSSHSMHGPAVGPGKSTNTGQLKNLSAMPPSGQAREAGSDGRYVMESTSAGTGLATRCAQATRGIIMLDNNTWKACGGKPKGASMGATRDASQNHQHMNH